MAKRASSASGEFQDQLWFMVGNEAASEAQRGAKAVYNGLPCRRRRRHSVFGGRMTLENIKAATAGIAGATVSDNAKLFPEVLKMVQNIPGGVTGLVKQFRDRGLANVATSLTATNGIQTITPEQIVQGLGMEKIDALATASGVDVKIVRKELVNVLPKVLQQLASAEKVLEVAAPAVKAVEAVAVTT